MTAGEYNQHMIRAAQFTLGLHPGDKAAASAAVPVIFAGLRGRLVSTTADALEILRLTASPHAGDGLSMLVDAAWASILADIRARISAMP